LSASTMRFLRVTLAINEPPAYTLLTAYPNNGLKSAGTFL
jgi:hypothetical protein